MAALDDGINELYVSPQIETMLGFSQKEWLEDPVLWYRQLHPDDRVRWHTEFAQTCAPGSHFRSEYRFLARDGRWSGSTARPRSSATTMAGRSSSRASPSTSPSASVPRKQLRRLSEELESQVRDRTAELARANEELNGADWELAHGPRPESRGGQPGQELVPGQHEPRAAHALERDHRLQRAAARPGRPERGRPSTLPTWERSTRRASTCWP